MSEKKTRSKSGKPRKNGPKGTARVALYARKVSDGLERLVERTDRWTAKTIDAGHRDKLKSVSILLNQAMQALNTAAEKSSDIADSGWTPPGPRFQPRPDFEKGESVRIKEEYGDYYKLFDKSALKNMKIGDSIKIGKRTSFFVPGIGVVPKSHLEGVSAE